MNLAPSNPVSTCVSRSRPERSVGCLVLLPIFLCLTLTGCGNSGPVEITDTREFDRANAFELPEIASSDLYRFRYQVRKTFQWTTPEGWTEVEPTSMREINLRFGEGDEGQAYLTRLPGEAGGVEANINRWRKQMGAAELSPEEVEELSTRFLLGREAKLLQIDGTYTGVRQPPKADYRLVGLVLGAGDTMVTVKMIGPQEVVRENEERFFAFSASVDLQE